MNILVLSGLYSIGRDNATYLEIVQGKKQLRGHWERKVVALIKVVCMEVFQNVCHCLVDSRDDFELGEPDRLTHMSTLIG